LEQIDTLSQTATEFSSFARFFSEEVTRIDLDELIREQREFFDNREDICFEYEGPGSEAPVDGRRSQLARVLVNLITNAIQAIDNSGRPAGRIRISLKPVHADESAKWRIDVEDNGPGVSEEDLDKLFKPNFTTKKTGTGLGLAICRSIVEQSQGTIDYSRSELGGARFTILFPAVC
ncbi:MAG: HAMP domain-containing histidine kinase, partial [Bacteroidales bacterium]|nr:HAMP domain-containing histidine kinase [Bacteroidales bacterium]